MQLKENLGRARRTLLEQKVMTGIADRDVTHRVIESFGQIHGEPISARRGEAMTCKCLAREAADV